MKKSFQLSAFGRQLILPAVSAGLLILCFPPFNLEFLAWIAIIPLFFAIEDRKPFQAFLISYIAGAFFFLGTIYWLAHVTLPGMFVVVLYLAVYFGLFGLLFVRYSLLTTHYSQLFFIPASWVTLELIRSHLFGGFGWSLLAHSQSYSLPVIQIADLTGAYGVSFLIVLVNTSIFMTIKKIRKGGALFSCLLLASCLVFVSLTYGIFRMKNAIIGGF